MTAAAATRRPWTDAERATLRRLYGRVLARDLAAELGRTVKSVHQAAVTLGLERQHRGTVDDAAIRDLHALGLTDAAIGERLGLWRKSVMYARWRLGLPRNKGGEWHRRQVAARTRVQCDAAGLANAAEIRLEAWRKAARDAGWPESVNGRTTNPVFLAILDSLWADGPATSRTLADRIGRPWKGRSCKTWASNGPGGSYLAELVRDGLVANLGRLARGRGKGRSACVYTLAPGVVKGGF